MIHQLKIKQNFLNDIIANKKNFEIRNDDRNYAIGDLISFSDGSLICEITYKLTHTDFPEGLKKDYCILGIRKVWVKSC